MQQKGEAEEVLAGINVCKLATVHYIKHRNSTIICLNDKTLIFKEGTIQELLLFQHVHELLGYQKHIWIQHFFCFLFLK